MTTKPTMQVTNKPRIHHWEGSVPPNLSPQPCSTLQSVSRNPVSKTCSAPAQPGPMASNTQGRTAVAHEVHMVHTCSDCLTVLCANCYDGIGWLWKLSKLLSAPLPTPASSHATSTPAMHGNSAAPTSSPAPIEPAPSVQSAPFCCGVEPPSSARPKAEDYTDDVKDLLLNAIKHFSCYIYTKNAFPSGAQKDTFATNVWKTACNGHEEPVLYELSNQIKCIVSHDITHHKMPG